MGRGGAFLFAPIFVASLVKPAATAYRNFSKWSFPQIVMDVFKMQLWVQNLAMLKEYKGSIVFTKDFDGENSHLSSKIDAPQYHRR